VTKLFVWILNSCPNFYYAQRKYKELNNQDLTTTTSWHDMEIKIDVIKHYVEFTGDWKLTEERIKNLKESLSRGETTRWQGKNLQKIIIP